LVLLDRRALASTGESNAERLKNAAAHADTNHSEVSPVICPWPKRHPTGSAAELSHDRHRQATTTKPSSSKIVVAKTPEKGVA
jgi:hypothetical protein